MRGASRSARVAPEAEGQPGTTSPEAIAATLPGYAGEGLSHVNLWFSPSTIAAVDWFNAVLDLLDRGEDAV
jgi:hypothetical protein